MNCCDFGKEYIQYADEANVYIGPAHPGTCIKMHSEIDTLGRPKWSKFKWVNIQYCPACATSTYKYFYHDKTANYRKSLQMMSRRSSVLVDKAVELYGLDTKKCLEFLNGIEKEKTHEYE